MRTTTAGVVSSLAAVAAAAKDAQTFAVLRFNGDGFLTEGRMDPVVYPGKEATHYHSIMGGSNFNLNIAGNDLLSSNCTTAKIANDFSNYWVPTLFFQDPKDQNKFTKVPLFYMNVYYFFEPTNDEVKAFPPGLKMLIGDVDNRNPPKSGAINLDPNQGEIQPAQFTCPRSSYNPPSYPANADGSTTGLQDPLNQGAGAGFPLYPCDGYASPLRQDIHFPSCYNPKAGLDDYKNNMAWPATGTDWKQDCPEGYIHVPHMFYEVYWNTPLFNDQWTPDGKNQPFVLSNGDVTGFSSHADFVSGWDENTLQTIIDTCNAGSVGMDTCPQIPGGLNQNSNCKISPMVTEPVSILANTVGQTLDKLPGNNPVTGWGRGGVTGGRVTSSHSTDSSPAAVSPASSAAASSAPASSAPASSVPASSNAVSAVQSVQGASPAENKPSSQGTGASESSSQPSGAAPPPVAVLDADSCDNSVVWEVVTVTQTDFVYAKATPAPNRRHEHAARHAHHAGRR